MGNTVEEEEERRKIIDEAPHTKPVGTPHSIIQCHDGPVLRQSGDFTPNVHLTLL